MDYVIRAMRPAEYPLLEDFLYEAIFVPEGFEGEVPRSIVHDDPKCRAAFEGFGTLPDDRAVVAEDGGVVVGACWARTTDEYGHIDSETPSFSISLYQTYRGRGIGSALMRCMLDELRAAGYARASLSVQKENPALRLYERQGFRIVGDGAERVEEGACAAVDLRPALTDYYARQLADGSFLAWLAVDGERIVATGGISIVEKPPYYGCPTGRIGLISSMFTDAAYRRQGIARDLLCRLVDEACRRGCGAVQITASDAGVPLYENLGFARNDNFRQLVLA